MLIDLRFRQPGDVIEVQTKDSLWSITVLDTLGIVSVNTTDPQILGEKRVQFVSSVIGQKERVYQLIQGWCFLLRFADGTYISSPVVSAVVKGSGWEYKVF